MGMSQSFFTNLTEIKVFAHSTLESVSDDILESTAVAGNAHMLGHSGFLVLSI